MLESEFKKRTINSIKHRLDPFGWGGFYFIQPALFSRSQPDLVILGLNTWAVLEFKQSYDAPQQPNQEYNVTKMSQMSYASFIYPENAEEVINDLERLFSS